MSSAYKFTPVKHKGTEGETTVVDRVALFTDKDQNMVIKFMIRHTRRPEVIFPFFFFFFKSVFWSSINFYRLPA